MNDPTQRKTPAGKGGGAFENVFKSSPKYVEPCPVSQVFSSKRNRLDEAKRRVPLSLAARALGLDLKKPNGVQRSPLRPDRSPSFSATQDRLWRDHANDTGGDVVSFIEAATGCEPREAIRRVLVLAGLDTGPGLPPPRLAPRPLESPPPPKRDALTGLDLRFPTVGELASIARARRWPLFVGLEIAARRDLLRTARVSHRGGVFESWIFTDADRKTGQARRLDGEPWPGPDGRTFKSLSLRSDENHPPGLADLVAANRPAVLLCEGEPDTLGALLVVWCADAAETVGVLCLTGASRGLPPPVLAALQGRRVRILRQSDPPRPDCSRPSHRAAAVWVASLGEARICADVASLDGLTRPDGQPAKDVADLCADADLEQLEQLAAALLKGLAP